MTTRGELCDLARANGFLTAEVLLAYPMNIAADATEAEIEEAGGG